MDGRDANPSERERKRERAGKKKSKKKKKKNRFGLERVNLDHSSIEMRWFGCESVGGPNPDPSRAAGFEGLFLCCGTGSTKTCISSS